VIAEQQGAESRASTSVMFFEVKSQAIELIRETEVSRVEGSNQALFSNDSNRVYVSHESGYHFNFQDRKLPRLTPSRASFKSAAFSPDGQRLARLMEFNQAITHALQVFDLPKYQRTVMRVDRQHLVSRMECLDAQAILIAGNRGVSLVDLDTESTKDILVHGRRPGISLIEFHPTEPLVVGLTFESEVFVIDTSTSKSLGMPFQVVGDVVKIDFGAVPGSAVVVTRRNGIQIWDWTRGQPLTPKLFVNEPIAKASISKHRNLEEQSDSAEPHASYEFVKSRDRWAEYDLSIMILTESGELRKLKSITD
jgi:hypothetical protein